MQSTAWHTGRGCHVLLCSPSCRGVSPSFHCCWFLLLVGQRHRGSRVCFCYCHLLCLGGIFPAVWAVARVVDLGGTVLVETVGDAALRLTLHESALKKSEETFIPWSLRALPLPHASSAELLNTSFMTTPVPRASSTVSKHCHFFRREQNQGNGKKLTWLGTAKQVFFNCTWETEPQSPIFQL